ncbi:Aminopeptidase 2 mitochondrial [Cymbomonas tetramitiformis]|uniref:Aminopeptidase 2 mitochondrial n=1 Tax=Cymbomonas tetramitiformis TaxID=36881 RepID=A0AAE0LEY3_9CHLO|nr:Aminopeptidase 2 mitochondrial [Cymbomonas tetramitiformis]
MASATMQCSATKISAGVGKSLRRNSSSRVAVRPACAAQASGASIKCTNVSRRGLSSKLSVDGSFKASGVSIKTLPKRSVAVRAEAEKSEGGMFASITEKFPWLETFVYFAVWYLFNVRFNIINKQIYNYFPYPWFVSCVHLAVGLVITLFFWGTRVVKFEKPESKTLNTMTAVAFCHAVGHCLTNVSFAAVAVSFTHTVKTLEPVFSSIGSYLVNGTVYSLPLYASLIPIMGGVAICAATELSFTWIGFLTAMSSNALFAARAIFSKKLMSGMSSINVYNYVSMIALLICIPPTIFFEGATLAKGMEMAAAKVGTETFYWALWNVGMFYHLYNQVAYQALGKVEPVTHAVGNVGKRIFVIGFSVLAFGNKLTTQSIVGSIIAIAGAGLYGYLKGVEAENAKKEATA